MKFADISGLHNHFFILLEKYLILKPYFNVTAVSNFLAACSVFFKSYRNYYYNCYIKRSTNNFFITITNMLGEVFFAFSAGRLESFRNKKKRRNAAVLPYIFQHISLILHRQFAITKIKHLFVSLRIRQAKRIYWLLRRRGFKINKLINILPRTHSNTLYKKFKKLRRV